MRSAPKAGALLLGLVLATASFAARPPHVLGSDAAEAGNAIESLKHDPNLEARTKTTKALRWKDSESPPPKDTPTLGWLETLFSLFADGTRVLVWVVGSALVALAVIWILRVLRLRSPRVRHGPAPAPPSHIQNLDVRPTSLPADIAAAAAALLTAGQIREALSLLYRGALSRALHRHGIAIAESSTEGEVLSAVSPRLGPPGAQYFARLVALWLQTVYAAEAPANEAVADLCRDFAVLDGTPA